MVLMKQSQGIFSLFRVDYVNLPGFNFFFFAQWKFGLFLLFNKVRLILLCN